MIDAGEAGYIIKLKMINSKSSVFVGLSPLVRVTNLTVEFGSLRILDNVNFVIYPGEVVGLAGENGAGKTTLVRCIAGELTAHKGDVIYSDVLCPKGQSPLKADGIGVVWQDLALCDNLDAIANLFLGEETGKIFISEATMYRHAKQLFSELGINLPVVSTSVMHLSGGQRQLLAVARALRQRPKLLILDEPTASLGVAESRQIESLIASTKGSGTATILVSHDVEQLFRLADRIVVMRQGRIVGELNTSEAHPDDVVALMSGQPVNASPRRQLSRLHALMERLSGSDPSSWLSLIVSTLGAALSTEKVCVHVVQARLLKLAAHSGFEQHMRDFLDQVDLSNTWIVPVRCVNEKKLIVDTLRIPRPLANDGNYHAVVSCWSVPVMSKDSVVGVLSVLRDNPVGPNQDELQLLTLYAAHAAEAIERDNLFTAIAEQNNKLKTIRRILEVLAGPLPVIKSLELALDVLVEGLGASGGVLLSQKHGQIVAGQANLSLIDPNPLELVAEITNSDGGAQNIRKFIKDDVVFYGAAFSTQSDKVALLVWWVDSLPGERAEFLVIDAANSIRLGLEREAADASRQEAEALRKTQKLQKDFLMRLSHELRTPLTAIQGYASTLLAPDVTWDQASQRMFLERICAESSRVTRLVGDLLDVSAIESGTFSLICDWCDLKLVIDAAVSCLPREVWPQIFNRVADNIPPIWADHDRLEQVFVNVIENAIRHNPPGTKVEIYAYPKSNKWVEITVLDNGAGLRSTTAASGRRIMPSSYGLGLHIASAIVEAHGGKFTKGLRDDGIVGTKVCILLPTDEPQVSEEVP